MKKVNFFKLAKPVLHRVDAEIAHHLTIKALAYGFYPKDKMPDAPRLAQTVCGIRFNNPVGMAAGFDKNAEALTGLFALGFGFVEAGTVTPSLQKGNPRPRVFRDIKSRSVINRMGFPSVGAGVFEANLNRFRARAEYSGIVGINIGKNRDSQDPAADYLALVERFAPSADYIAINISSPNTPGLRDLQNREFLLPFLESVQSARARVCVGQTPPPILVKIAPDLSDFQIDALAQTFLESGINGVIATNTTLDRPDVLPQGFKKQAGGLSGPYVRHKSTLTIRRLYEQTDGKLPIIGVGGVSSAADAYAKIRAGASLVQLYTALVFEGPALIDEIKNGLIDLLNRDGFKTLKDAVGADHS
jgi:dihydroorotate dehydrogenase